jgi:hypothetical protein
MKIVTLAVLLFIVMRSHAQQNIYKCEGHQQSLVYRQTPLHSTCRIVNLPKLMTTKSVTSVVSAGEQATSLGAIVEAGDDVALQRAEARLAQKQAQYIDGVAQRLGSERNYANYAARVADLENDVAQAQQQVDVLKKALGH